ncbi:Ltp family lipoprotein [Demequina litorisediminis]|uniref:Ltp family lipoprotein n=1 Tax=Demequina litorisediminis TaxID=1849022 RepID=UPI0024E0BEE7|nr:Ltp family lipoprotein [Demequina litorisediminis]
MTPDVDLSAAADAATDAIEDVTDDITEALEGALDGDSTDSDGAATADLSAGQANAVGSAESYLDFASFSRSGLIEQLEFEGYETADAEFAVDFLEVDWDAQAVGSATDYIDFSAFSKSGLIDQARVRRVYLRAGGVRRRQHRGGLE